MQFTDLLLYFTFHIDSTPTFLHFNLYLNTAYAAHTCLYKLVLLNVFYLCLSLSQAIVAPRLFLRLEWYTPCSTHRLLYM